MRKLSMLFAAVLLVLAACTKQDFEPRFDSAGDLEFRDAGLTGAIYTTDENCMTVNGNLFDSKEAVYLNGGPRGGSSGLPDGFYFVKVTNPSGSELLGKTNTASVEVVDGKFVQCYQLSAILFSASSGFTAPGYDDTPNNGGEYKVWVSPSESFPARLTKTDNFKVKPTVQPPKVRLDVLKFYDANANGAYDDGELLLDGWKVNIKDNFGFDEDYFTPVSIELDPAYYIITEYMPAENSWLPTTPTTVEVELNSHTTVRFGNLCLGGGNGKTLGFWSNRNGQAIFTSTPPAPNPANLAYMVSLNLRNANGTHFDPASYTAFRSWLLSANATNMSYMLSAQMAAMALNVNNGLVNGNALIYAPGALGANALGFAAVNVVVAEANAELGMYGYVLAGNERRSYQEALKNALDKANNNLNFVQAQPCPFSFPVEEEDGE